MAAVWIAVKDLHDIEIAEKTEKCSKEHVGWLLYNWFFDDSDSSFNEEFSCDYPDDGDIEQGS